MARTERKQGCERLTAEDQIWGQYMEQKRGWRELVALVRDEQIQVEFGHRAIEVLLAPDIRDLPFRVNVDSGLHTLVGLSNDWLKNITREQACFIAGKLPGYIRGAKRKLQEDKHDISAGGALFTYNDLIPRLLAKLPFEQAEKLFESFSINDPLVYWDMDAASGYNPLINLYYDEAVDEGWKRKAAKQIHRVIESEQKGEAMPRAEHEKAALTYGQVLGLVLYRKEGLPISSEFYQEEIAFMLGVKTGKPVVDLWHTGKVLDLLDNAELKHRFARRQVLTGMSGSSHRFGIYNNTSAQTAEYIISKFPDDTELKSYLEEQLREWQTSSEREKQRAAQANQAEQEIMSRMRRPVASG